MSFTYVYIIGAAQGLVLAIALWVKQDNVRSNRVLAVWLLCLVYDLTVKSIYLINPSTPFLPAYILANFFPFLYGSFFYLYVRTITLKRPLVWLDMVHFLGFILMAGVNLHWIFNPWEDGPRGWVSFDLTLYLYSVSYVVAGLISIRKYRRTLHQQQSNTDGISLLWIDVMAYFQALIWFIAVTQWLVPIKDYNVWVIYLAVAIWMTVMGYLALLQQNIKPLQTIDAPKKVDNERFPEVDTKLTQLMGEDRLFLDPTLNMGQLAKKSGYPEYLVSLVINKMHQQTFREYINQLRIEAAVAMLQDTQNSDTILDIAYASGFTSKSTFNSAFKRLHDQTPSQLRQMHL
ncbi:hypothetical protein MNBD_GAMMA02-1154 [hydrothermal vent metagenome]|uniref:HTH araC/xylS-type domain-containing protein n=1 Tax=hydrothermal vent metagenome TaxID=652676 RepID=A0A3B0W481_9ZZZZ